MHPTLARRANFVFCILYFVFCKVDAAAHHVGKVGHGCLNVVGRDRVVTGDAEYHCDIGQIFLQYIYNISWVLWVIYLSVENI